MPFDRSASDSKVSRLKVSNDVVEIDTSKALINSNNHNENLNPSGDLHEKLAKEEALTPVIIQPSI